MKTEQINNYVLYLSTLTLVVNIVEKCLSPYSVFLMITCLLFSLWVYKIDIFGFMGEEAHTSHKAQVFIRLLTESSIIIFVLGIILSSFK
jgi:hypothetical protein